MDVAETRGVELSHSGVAPKMSVVMPTYNRIDRLKTALEALARQTVDPNSFEMIVVSDGSTDGTDEYLASGLTPLPVIGLSQPNAGPAAARNHGVSVASAPLIVFVDDDIIATPTLLERHLLAHADSDHRAVIGPMVNAPDFPYTPWVRWEQAMLEKQYAAMRNGTMTPSFHQFYTGNASVPRVKFDQAGGFNPKLRRAEDSEFAFRLSELGVEFVFDEVAAGFHYAERSFRSWLSGADLDGRNMVALVGDGQTWRLVAMAQNRARRHVFTRALVTAFTPRPRLAKVVISGLRLASTASSKLGQAEVSKLALSGVWALRYSLSAADEFGGAAALNDAIRSAVADQSGRLASDDAGPTVGLILEQTLGHVTHSDNLQKIIPGDSRVRSEFRPIEYAVEGWRSRVPIFSNWTVRAGVRAGRAIAELQREHNPDVLFIHTQVPATLVCRWMKRIPTVVSIDATPIQYDSFGSQYGHARASDRVEKVKWRLNRRSFRSAAHIISWSAWSKQSLIDDYGIDGSKVTVLAPGVNIALWAPPVGEADHHPDVVRVLFVGGDLERKGGLPLLEAIRRMRAERGSTGRANIELHMVTNAHVDPQDGVILHRGLRPNSPELIQLYHCCDIFCLPTIGDCLPMVLSEAGAAGLPLVTTDVGAIHEIALDGETGLIVAVGDVESLVAALDRLVDDSDLRDRLGVNAAALVADRFDAAKNAEKLVDVFVELAHQRVGAGV